MDHSIGRLARPFSAMAAFLPLLAPGEVQANVIIVPHRAVYDLELASSSSKAKVDGFAGRIAYELNGSACKGWDQAYRMVSDYRYRDGSRRLIDLQSEISESADGKELTYRQKQFTDGKLSEEKDVSAKRPDTASPGEGAIRLPAEKTFAIAAEALFPTQYQTKLIDTARQGTKLDQSLLFDGSYDDKSVQVVTTIGPEAKALSGADEANAAAKPLAGVVHWPVNTAYFPANDPQAEVPDFQMKYDLFENGIASDLKLDYGDIVLRGKLVNLELLPAAKCN
jgi:EipB-like